MGSILVNTWPTKNTPWVVRGEVDYEVLRRIARIIISLPRRVYVPWHFNVSSLPRYYRISIEDEEVVNIEGVRRDGAPTRWSFCCGYWHYVIHYILYHVLLATAYCEG